MTRHCMNRVEDRRGLKGNSAKKLVENAKIAGKTDEDFSGREKYFLKSKGEYKCVARYYSGFIFIFSLDNVCITMYQAPEWFGKAGRYDGKREIRDSRKYFVNYCDRQIDKMSCC